MAPCFLHDIFLRPVTVVRSHDATHQSSPFAENRERDMFFEICFCFFSEVGLRLKISKNLSPGLEVAGIISRNMLASP